MRVGVFAPPWGPTATPADFESIAEAAEHLGYPTLWVGDHVVFPRTVESSYLYNESGVSPFDPDQPLLEPIGLLSYLAGRTTRIRLGISVLVLPMREPVVTAKMLAGLAVLSRSRLIVGVGVGWMREEFEALGADFDERAPATEEYLAILGHLWRGDPRPFEGKYRRFPSLGFRPAPPPIPIVVGGNSTMAMRRAATTDGWHAIRMTPEALRPKVVGVRRMVEERGGDPAAFEVVYRGSLLDQDIARAGPPQAARMVAAGVRATLDAYASVGVDELIIELPDLDTLTRVAWLEWLAEHVLGTLSA